MSNKKCVPSTPASRPTRGTAPIARNRLQHVLQRDRADCRAAKDSAALLHRLLNSPLPPTETRP